MSFFSEKSSDIENICIVKTPVNATKIPKCMVINGNIISCESTIIDGRVNGDIVSIKSVIINLGAVVVGKIKAKEVRINGVVEGPIEAQLIEIEEDATIEGYMIGDNITIAGRSDGDILSRNTLIIEKSADVTTLETKSKIIKITGVIRGDITGTELIEISDGGVVDGDIRTKEYHIGSDSKITGLIHRYIGTISNNFDKSNKAITNSR